jgi:lipase
MVRGTPLSLEVPVSGGTLAAELSGPPPREAEAVVVLVHGITANLAAWGLVQARLPQLVSVVAVDLRGRAGSAGLPGPWGMQSHADDLLAVLDHIGATEAILVGHSMGAFVTAVFACRHPERIRAAVLVDGGVAPVVPDGSDTQVALDRFLGPVTGRLTTTFRRRVDHHEFWQAHPAFLRCWNSTVESFADHDLGGSEPALRSRARIDAVRSDGAEILLDAVVGSAIEQMQCPTELLRVERGLSDQPDPVVPLAAAMHVADTNPHVSVTTVPNLNHYTVIFSPTGADAVAAAIVRALAR